MGMRQRAKALADFQNDPPTTVFLLSIRAGVPHSASTKTTHCLPVQSQYSHSGSLIPPLNATLATAVTYTEVTLHTRLLGVADWLAGAVGINLTQANFVFLMEPCMNLALEQQAIGRVHRMGQRRAVLIRRLQMADSVETRMAQRASRLGENGLTDPSMSAFFLGLHAATKKKRQRPSSAPSTSKASCRHVSAGPRAR